MSDKSVETFCSKIRFSSVWETFAPLPSPQTMLNKGGGGDIGELTLEANKMEYDVKVAYYSFDGL